MPDTPEQLQSKMARLRSEVREDVESVFDTAEELTDWKHYVRRYPWVTVGAAAAVGFLLAPSRKSAPAADFDAFLAQAKQRGLVIQRDASTEAASSSSWIGGLMGLAGPLVMRATMAYAGRKLGEYLEGMQEEDSAPPERSSPASYPTRS